MTSTNPYRKNRESDHYPILVAELAARDLACYHTYNSRRSAQGFPDFVIPSVGRWQLHVELKAYPYPLSQDQADWLRLLLGPWRASFVVDVGQLGPLLLAVDNMKAGRADQLGAAGPKVVYVLGLIKGVERLGSAAVGEYVRPVDELAGGAPATVPRPHRPCTPRRARGS